MFLILPSRRQHQNKINAVKLNLRSFPRCSSRYEIMLLNISIQKQILVTDFAKLNVTLYKYQLNTQMTCT